MTHDQRVPDGPDRPVVAATEPALDNVGRTWPRWHTWRGVSGLVYASRGMTSPPAVVRGEYPRDLLDEISRWEANRA